MTSALSADTPIQIRGLTKTYANGYKALNGVNLDIPMGMFGLLGPNGAGKSSLMRTIAQALVGDPRLVIVDEPTAGLDPAERVRFLNLLSEISERAAIILSTHIVEDVSELCPQMAVLIAGEIRAAGQPLGMMQQLAGKVWRVRLRRDQLPTCETQHQVLSTRFFMGDIIARIFSEIDPGAGFEAVEPDLEDVYFCVMKEIPALQSSNADPPASTLVSPGL